MGGPEKVLQGEGGCCIEKGRWNMVEGLLVESEPLLGIGFKPTGVLWGGRVQRPTLRTLSGALGPQKRF